MAYVITKQGLEFIKNWEGCSESVYLDSGGAPTIGIGHLLTKSERKSGKIQVDGKGFDFKNGLDNKTIMALLNKDLQVAKSAVLKTQKQINYIFKQHQIDALVSFVFNIGAGAFDNSTMKKYFIRNEIEKAAAEFPRWKYDNGKIIQGLLNRRLAEQRLFEHALYI